MQDDLKGTTLPARRRELQNNFEIAECVDVDGNVTFWLLSPNDDTEPGNAGPTSAPHEQGCSL